MAADDLDQLREQFPDWRIWVVSPGDVLAGGVVSHAPIRHRAGGRDAMTVTSGDRAAQSGHRARLGGRLMRKRELTRGLATPPGWWACRRWRRRRAGGRRG